MKGFDGGFGGGFGGKGGFGGGDKGFGKADVMAALMEAKGKGKMMGGGGGPMGCDPMMMMKGKGMMPGKGGPMGGMGGGMPGAQNSWEYKPGVYHEEPGGHIGIEGLKDAVTRSCEPHVTLEKQWSKDDMVNKVCMCIFKTSAKWYKEDTRHKEAGTAIQAQALLEEFTEKIMGALANTCYDKPWFLEIYLSEAVALSAINTFKGGAMFKRTVAPIIVTHVDEAIFRYREEERHQRVMWEAISSVGIKADYLKKANKHLQTAYEAAHISAKYGTSPAASPELGMVQDFVMAWVGEFTRRAWDVLNNGINSPTTDQQIGVCSTLFQYLCDPAHSCLPHDLTQQLDQPPPPGWDFCAQAVLQLFSQQ
jgi:hypothetical protein